MLPFGVTKCQPLYSLNEKHRLSLVGLERGRPRGKSPRGYGTTIGIRNCRCGVFSIRNGAGRGCGPALVLKLRCAFADGANCGGVARGCAQDRTCDGTRAYTTQRTSEHRYRYSSIWGPANRLSWVADSTSRVGRTPVRARTNGGDCTRSNASRIEDNHAGTAKQAAFHCASRAKKIWKVTARTAARMFNYFRYLRAERLGD
jgi:hypothetical protein